MKRLPAIVLGGLLSAAAFATALVHDATASTPVVQGWNNVAYLGPSAPPSEALASIAGQYRSVWHWDQETQEYLAYFPDAPAFANSLERIETGDAIWIDVAGQGGTLPGLAGLRSGRYSVAASTFVPASDLAVYEKSFNELYPVSTDPTSHRYFAPVHLPDGVTITSMTAHFIATEGTVQVRLDYTPLSNGSVVAQVYKLAEVLSTEGSSPFTVEAYPHTVDNSANVYFLVVDLTGGPGSRLRGITISYTG